MAASPFQLPFDEAIQFFRQKVQLPSSGWTDIWERQHSQAFVVAGAAHDNLVGDLYNALRTAQSNGTGYQAFREQFEGIAAKYGWAYKGTPGWRSKVIYDTNITQAYNAGREAQMQAVKHLRPFAMYRHTSIEHPRLEHRAWNGLVLPLDDPWWDTHTPQNGWGCKCKKYSLSRTEAQREWEKAGKTGPDEAPQVEWEERTVGANGSNPRTVRVPKGIDPGFAYNPGKAWLEPNTVPPLQGYDAVLKERGATWPPGAAVPPLPKATPVSKSALVPAGTRPEDAVVDFLDVFGADMQNGAAFTDAAGSTVAISKALFQDGRGEFKWLARPDKASRMEYVNLLAMTLIEPDEIWWVWVKDGGDKGRWRLKRRYLRAFEMDGNKEFGVGVFEWGDNGWSGSTAFMGSQNSEAARAAYFDRQRSGRLMFSKD